MPCNNVTEQLEVVLDNDERLQAYTLQKGTCGQGVGLNALLLPRLKGLAVTELMAVTADDLCLADEAQTDIEEFLRLKHLFALQSALGAFTGVQAGGAGESCAIVGIAYDPTGITIQADIAVNIVTERIQACGHCGPG